MQRHLLSIFFAILIVVFPAAAQVAVVDSVIEGNIGTSFTLNASKKYLLKGFVNINPPATITIPPGTIIFGEKSSKGTLIINRGAKINANGTQQQPIVFTSQSAPGSRSAGDWGGIIIAGNASINTPGGTGTIEGGTGTIYGGGATPNDDDNSGVMRYVRLEYSGIAFLPDNEINGLTMGGVGRGTTLEYIQVSFNGDDSYEWFGGTVNAKYLISLGAVDDDLDVDLGFRGKVQFALIIREPNIADISGSNGWESDNDATGTFNAPRTAPVFSNVTSIGPMADTSAPRNANFRRGAHIRRSSLTSIYNSIVMGWPTGLLLDGTNTVTAAQNDTMQIRNSIWAGLRANNSFTTTVGTFNAVNWYNTASFGNRSYVQPAEVQLIDPFNRTNPNPRPSATSPAVTGANFSNPKLDAFFTPTTYVGAFSPTGPRWDSLWTNYDPQNTIYGPMSVEQTNAMVPESFELLQNYPNPFNPSTTIRFKVANAGAVQLKVYDMFGREVSTLVDMNMSAGTYEATFNGANLASGIYFYKFTAPGVVKTQRMTLAK